MRTIPTTIVALGVLTAAAQAQTSVSFPLDVSGIDPLSGQTLLLPDAAAIAALDDLDEVVMTGVPVPWSQADVTVELQRVKLEELEFGFRVNGQEAPGLLAGLELSVWNGFIQGVPGSDVMLSFSTHGNRGWISNGSSLAHVMVRADGDWSDSISLLVDDAVLTALGYEEDFDCRLDDIVDLSREALDGTPDGHLDHDTSSEVLASVSTELYACRVAVETDYQLFQVFNDLSAETAYVTTLLAAASGRYQTQMDTQLTYPYLQFYTTSADPWSSPDTGGSSIDMLNEFVGAWSGNLPVAAELAHFVSGANLGGGVAYLGVLCDSSQSSTFAVSGNIDGLTPFPVSQGPTTWDFIVFTHETGHNFGSPHTHDYNPPIDTCASGGCISNGTVMSYCHLCSGGLNNMTTFFHPTVVANVADDIANCLPVVAGIDAFPPTVVAPDVPTTLTVTVTGTPTAGVDLNYRFNGGSVFNTVALSNLGGGLWSGDLPAPTCDDSPEFFFSMDEATYGLLQTDTAFATVGLESVVFADDFSTSQGWTVGAPGDDATTGIWERDDPIGTSAQPSAGVGIGDPSCFFTGQGSPGGSLGEEDIDGGKTTLISPVIDLSGGTATISYWRWYSNTAGASPGADIFEVEITNDGSTWVDVETVGPGGPENSGGWFYNEFDVAGLVTPTSSVQVRFIASDEGSGSVVEAAVDDFKVARTSCEVCQSDLGFGGPGSLNLSVCGETLASGGTADLELSGGPSNAPAWIAYSLSFNPTSLFGGTVVTVPADGVLATSTDASGAVSVVLTGGGGPAAVYLQGLTYDPVTLQFSISNAIVADYLP